MGHVPGLAFLAGLAHTHVVDRLWEGCQLFQAGKPFEAHEAWEAVWNECRRRGSLAEARELQAAILVCGVAVLLAKGRRRGACALAQRAGELGADWQSVLKWEDPARLRELILRVAGEDNPIHLLPELLRLRVSSG